ncbi:hypothetical protein [Streptomyces anulatus]|uniref:hypothetical protein n=1 Tax=Streptomyces anulatus TaxID=1892 RepID=UPI001C27A7C8|nr:hypothetical protein [Streptomyces anulatus]
MPATPAPRTVVHRILADYRQMAARHHAALKEHCDVDGLIDGELDAYEETRRVAALEADEKLKTFIQLLTDAFGLPDDRPVTVLGANQVQFQVTPGQLDETARTAFTEGQCHALARAVAERTGWENVVLAHRECAYDYNQCGMDNFAADDLCICQLSHLAAVRPDDGYLVDADGAHDPQDIRAEERFDIVPMSPALWKLIDTHPTWRDADMPVARTMVAPLLDALSGQTTGVKTPKAAA